MLFEQHLYLVFGQVLFTFVIEADDLLKFVAFNQTLDLPSTALNAASVLAAVKLISRHITVPLVDQEPTHL